MKILAFSAGLLLPIGIAVMMGGAPTVPEPQVVAAKPEVATPEPVAHPIPVVQAAPEIIVEPMPVIEEPAPLPLDAAGTERAWRNWVVTHNVKASSMALGFDGDIVQSADYNRRADAAYPIASLSKAITAMCLNHILPEMGYDWNTTLKELAPALALINMPPHEGIQDLRLADLATHNTGFPKNIDGNETAGEGRNLYTQQHFAREALTNPSRQPERRRFFYSNVNYAVLGQIITALTGAPYGEVCADRIMKPAGATQASVGGRMWATAGFGGWSASAEEYAKFAMRWLNPGNPWIHKPMDYAYDEDNRSGLGVFYNIDEDRFYIQHNGLWRSKKETRQHGAIFVISDTGATFVANWQGSLDNKAYQALRQAIKPHLR